MVRTARQLSRSKRAGITTAAVFLIMTLVFLLFSITFYFLYGMMADSFTDALDPITKDTATRLAVTNFLRSPLEVEKDSQVYVMDYSELISLGTTNDAWTDIMEDELDKAEEQLAFYDLVYGEGSKGSDVWGNFKIWNDEIMMGDRWGVEIIKDDDVVYELGTVDPFLTKSFHPVRVNYLPIWNEDARKKLIDAGDDYYENFDANELHSKLGFFEDHLIPNRDGSFTIFRYYWRPQGVLNDKD